MKIVFTDKSGITKLQKTIPRGVHEELSNVFEGRKLAMRIRQIAEPKVPMRTGNLRFSPTIHNINRGAVIKNGVHYDSLMYQAINQEQAEEQGLEMEMYWNYAEKMELEHFKNYTTPGTSDHYLSKAIAEAMEMRVPQIMIEEAVQRGARKGGKA